MQFGEDFLHAFFMVFVSGANKTIVLDIKSFPQLLDANDHAIDEILRSFAHFFGFALELLPVFISACEEIGIEALRFFIAGEGIGEDGGIGIAHVEVIAGVVDGGGYIKILHCILLL